MVDAKIFALGLVIASTILFVPECSAQVTFGVFTDPHPVVTGGTIAFGFAGDKFVGSVQAHGLGVLYSTDLSGGNVQPFAPTVSLALSWFDEHALAVSLGLGGFPHRDIYVGAGNGVMHISHDGTKSNMLVTGLPSDVRSLRFDAVGTFGHDLLLTTFVGQIYRVTSAGVPTLLASIGEELPEGLDVVPLGAKFGSFDGQLIVTTEGSGLLRAIDWSGKVSILNSGSPIPSAESINFVPINLGASGTSIEGFYQAHYTPNVVKAEASEFAGFKGDAIVSSEFGPVWRVHWNGTAFEITVLAANPGQVEDGIFVTPSMIDPPSGGSCKSNKDDDDKDRNHDSHRPLP